MFCEWCLSLRFIIKKAPVKGAFLSYFGTSPKLPREFNIAFDNRWSIIILWWWTGRELNPQDLEW